MRELERYLDGARAAHVGWIRFDVNWNVIQYRGQTSYDWEPFDRVVRAVTSRGMRVLAGVLFTPPWARAPGTSSRYPPSDLADYARFVTAVVERYAPMGVHAYEIWNEPNIASFRAPRPDPARYAELLTLAYPAIKSHDRQATVVQRWAVARRHRRREHRAELRGRPPRLFAQAGLPCVSEGGCHGGLGARERSIFRMAECGA